ncbi:MAG: hypothetical protein Kow0069_35340 [Promethearchaeota archaeon]
MGELPLQSHRLDDDPAHHALLREMFGAAAFEARFDEDALVANETLLREHPGGGAAAFLPAKLPPKEKWLRRQLSNLLAWKGGVEDLVVEGRHADWVLYQHRVAGDDHLYLAFNARDSPVRATFRFVGLPVGHGLAAVLDPETGLALPHRAGGTVELERAPPVARLTLPPGAGYLFWFSPEAGPPAASGGSPAAAPRKSVRRPRELPLGEWTWEPPRKNLFVLRGPWKVVGKRDGGWPAATTHPAISVHGGSVLPVGPLESGNSAAHWPARAASHVNVARDPWKSSTSKFKGTSYSSRVPLLEHTDREEVEVGEYLRSIATYGAFFSKFFAGG